MGMLDENSLYNNLNVEKNQNNILKNIKIYNNSKNQNNIIPESSNYGSFTKNELNNEYLFARYPNGMINVLDTKGNTPKNETTNINLNSTIYKKANNPRSIQKVNIIFPEQSYNIESFGNQFQKNNKNLFLLLFIIFVLFILWLLKIKNH